MSPRALRTLSLALALASVAVLATAAARGDLRLALLLVVPLLVGEGPLAALGMLLLVAAGLAGFAALLAGPRPASGDDERPERAATVRHGGIVLLGPLPIVWGSDARTTLWLVLATLALALVVGALLVLR